jgi:hypothetical protein
MPTQSPNATVKFVLPRAMTLPGVNDDLPASTASQPWIAFRLVTRAGY